MVALRETQGIDLETASSLELLKNRIETERLEVIPLSSISTEHALIDEVHAAELGNSMKQRRGQISSIAVRARLTDAGRISYDVIDGFHRAEGKKRIGESTIKANVLYGCTDEEMYDLRILAASSVKSVQFPRIAEWITKSWETTSWAKRGLTVTQAFVKTVIPKEKSRSTSGVKLSPQELEELRDWVNAKCKRWGRNPWSIYRILLLIADADPSLVKRVRSAEGGVKDREGKITPARLKAVVEGFPGAKNFSAQRAIMKIAVERRLTAEETELLTEKLKGMKFYGMSEDQIYRMVSKFEVKREVTIFDSKENKSKPKREEKDLVRRVSTLETVVDLKKRVTELERELISIKSHNDFWWRDAEYLSPLERESVEKIMYGGQRIEGFCQIKKITEKELWMTIRSAFTKKQSRARKLS